MTIGEALSGAVTCGILFWTAAKCLRREPKKAGLLRLAAGTVDTLLLVLAAWTQQPWLAWTFYVALAVSVAAVLYAEFRWRRDNA